MDLASDYYVHMTDVLTYLYWNKGHNDVQALSSHMWTMREPPSGAPSFLLWPSRLEAAQIVVRINLLQPKLEPAISLLRASHQPLFLESQNRPWPTRLWTYRSLPPSHLRSLGLTALCWPSCSFANLASITPQLRCVPALFFVSKTLLLAVNLMHSLTSIATSHGGLSWLSTYLLHLVFPFSS